MCREKFLLKALGILTLLVLSSMFVCPVLAELAPARTEHSCTDQPHQQKHSQQDMKACCDQQALPAKQARFAPNSFLVGFAALMPASVSFHDDLNCAQALPTSRLIKTSNRLAALSILRI
jgi:hypothetical protein